MKKIAVNSKSLINRLRLPFVRFYQNLPIRYKLLLVLNIIMIIPLVGLSYINYRNAEISLTKKSTQYTQDILKMIEIRLKDYTQNLNLISQELLPDKRVISSLNDYSSDALENYEESVVVENILKKAIFTRNEIQSIALISNKGNYHPADKNNRVISIKQLVPYKSELYGRIVTDARQQSGSPIFYLDVEKGRVKNLFLARTVYDSDSFEEIGVLIVLLRPDYLDTVFKDLVNEDTRNIMILSPRHEVIVERSNGSASEIAQNLTNLKGYKGWFIDASKSHIVSYLVMQEAPGWEVVSLVSMKSLYKDIDLLRQKIVISSILFVLFLCGISLLMTADFIRPFKKLMVGMEKVQKGDNNVYISLDRKDEIGYLGEAFNRMVREMNTLSNWVYREQLTRKEAEIKALQSQINPPFLFNTLESINWMAQLNEVPEISNMVTALSSLMEASIGRDDKLITFEEELSYIDSYILILKTRFEDRITLIKKIDEKALEVHIPRLLIQPLVENAIQHGIDKNKSQGTVTLSASVEDSELTISIEDDGEGIEENELKILKETLSMNNEAYFKRLNAKKGKSIGLENVNRRIKLFYGERYGLQIESQKDVFTRVSLIIPLEKDSRALEGGAS
ncbi:MAG: sensor histidine kinase [Clostridia bacterium]|nr:sensor histidine kinase [Clostridia bacterium]